MSDWQSRAGGTSAPSDSWFIRPLENHKEEKKENDDV
jgi:hypothetical protein